VAGLMVTGMIYTFSNVSGAHFNPNLSFALWLTNKLSNRKFVLYVIAQLSASALAMALCAGFYSGDMEKMFISCTLTPLHTDESNKGKVFFNEFVSTFFLIYIVLVIGFEDAESDKKNNMSVQSLSDSKGLAVYTSTPQSKTGFAPFVIGFLVFSLIMLGGESKSAFNQARQFGPALLSGKWDSMAIYWSGQLCGAASAAMLVDKLHVLGVGPPKEVKRESAKSNVIYTEL
jgi:glycerol uptake facilitator-like aquaporin